MRVYLAGPMTGIPEYNFPAFDAAAKRLRALGHEVFSPADNDRKRFGGLDGVENAVKGRGMDYVKRRCMADDVDYIMWHAEAIALLPGWEHSTGVAAELALAVGYLKLPVYLYQETDPCLSPITLKRVRITLLPQAASTTSQTPSRKLPESLRPGTSNTIRDRRSIGTATKARMRLTP